ncbi:hypothetical protein RJ639_024721 [Escallonia herrerae]|uniref:Retrovirus-related Pol polyprotein from transposon TNT 1-94 n=1 Tax=Escallonia herrerae TaxID=1293975 RepID=A0AA88UXX1_9ASTE|nr:hypothetical protein RJ639_024721 [Escallonia herrerae]
MKEGTSINDHLGEYNKVTLDLQNIDVRIEEENQALLLLCSLPSSYKHLVTILLYRKDNISIKEVEAVINSQELRKVSENKGEEHGDGLMARGRRTDHAKSRYKGGSSSSNRGWILDTSCSYHICPNKDRFTTYLSFDGGKVLLGNDVACKVVEIGSIQIRMHDGTFDSKGCSYRASGGVMRIMKGALVVIKGIFDHPAYAHVNDGKLELRTNKYIFFHYASGVKEYRLWCPNFKSSRFPISRDVTFDESSMLLKKELIDTKKNYGAREKVERRSELQIL